MGLYDAETGKTNAKMGSGVKSFETVGKNLHIIARRFMKNERLMKLLLINDENADSVATPPPTDEQIAKAFGDNIRTTPMIDKDGDLKNYIIIQVGGFTPTNNENYKNYFLIFDIICNIRTWQMADYTPRALKIMAEIEDVIAETKINSLGPVHFFSANNLVINEEMAGFTLTYQIVSE